MSREVEEGRRDAEERRGRSRGVRDVEDDGAGHLVIEEGATGDLPARIAEMEAEIRTLREANKSECGPSKPCHHVVIVTITIAIVIVIIAIIIIIIIMRWNPRFALSERQTRVSVARLRKYFHLNDKVCPTFGQNPPKLWTKSAKLSLSIAYLSLS